MEFVLNLQDLETPAETDESAALASILESGVSLLVCDHF